MDFSVIICTYNRAPNLPACIGDLARQEDTEGLEWEVLVVDNNSTDDTRATVERLSATHPINLRYAFEPEQGLSSARNCGIRETDAPHVVFIDDDIRVSPRWLRAYADIFAAHDCDAAGGRILVESPQPLPRWIRSEMMGFLGQFDCGDEPMPLDGTTRHPFGGNMAFDRRALERVGDFDPNLGRKGSGASADELFKGEETEYFHRLATTGGEIWYAPGATVFHHILPYQLKRRFFLTIHFNEGYQSVHFEQRKPGRQFLGVPLFVYPQAVRALVGYLRRTITVGPSSSMRQLMTFAYFIGKIRAHMARRYDSGARL